LTNFIDILKATRIHRTLTALTAIMVPVAFANKINSNILYLALVCILIYAVAGIQNAKKDNDYKLPKNSKIFSALFLFSGLILSLNNYIIFFTFLIWILLGVFYNLIARYILFGDVTILSITHHTLPTLSSSLLLGLDLKTTLLLTSFMFITFWFIIHLKNLKDAIEDKKRGYKTLTINIKNGTIKTKLLFEISFLCMFIAYFIFDLSKIYLYALVGVMLIKILVTYFIDLEKHEIALNFMRLMVIAFLIALIVDRTNNYSIIFISLILGLAYLMFLGFDIVKVKDRVGVVN
jgi:4-hydroxybenzoate polyprenyltransferase